MATLIFTNKRMVNSVFVVLCCIHPWFTTETLKQYELAVIYWHKVVPIIRKMTDLYVWNNLILDHPTVGIHTCTLDFDVSDDGITGDF